MRRLKHGKYLHFSAAFDYRLSVTILRVKDGLDYSNLTEDDEPAGNANGAMDQIIPHIPSSTGLSNFTSRMMHADSNLCLVDLVGTVLKKPTPSSTNVAMSKNSSFQFDVFRCQSS